MRVWRCSRRGRHRRDRALADALTSRAARIPVARENRRDRNRNRELVRRSLQRTPRRVRRNLRHGAAHRGASNASVQNLGGSDRSRQRKASQVRITDRGPFVDGRIIDLSLAAAREIEMLGPGTARVRLKVIPAPADVTRSDPMNPRGSLGGASRRFLRPPSARKPSPPRSRQI